MTDDWKSKRRDVITRVFEKRKDPISPPHLGRIIEATINGFHREIQVSLYLERSACINLRMSR